MDNEHDFKGACLWTGGIEPSIHGAACPNCQSTETVYSSLQACYKCDDCGCWFDGNGVLEPE